MFPLLGLFQGGGRDTRRVGDFEDPGTDIQVSVFATHYPREQRFRTALLGIWKIKEPTEPLGLGGVWYAALHRDEKSGSSLHCGGALGTLLNHCFLLVDRQG